MYFSAIPTSLRRGFNEEVPSRYRYFDSRGGSAAADGHSEMPDRGIGLIIMLGKRRYGCKAKDSEGQGTVEFVSLDLLTAP